MSDAAIPLQGHYTASKHAVKGFTDTLRMELEKDEAPVSVTLIQPAAIDTPYPEHAKNYMDVEPKHQPPVYAPEVVAEASLVCAERAEREVLVGGGAKFMASMAKLAPRLGDKFNEATAFKGSRTDEPARDEDTLYAPRSGDGRVRGHYPGHVMKSSAYTKAALSPGKALLGLAALGVGVALATRSRRGNGK